MHNHSNTFLIYDLAGNINCLKHLNKKLKEINDL